MAIVFGQAGPECGRRLAPGLRGRGFHRLGCSYRLGCGNHVWRCSPGAISIACRFHLCRVIHFYHIVMHPCIEVARPGEMIYLYRLVACCFYFFLPGACMIGDIVIAV